MDIKNEIINGMKIASDAATDAVQILLEKNRLRANANRIRQVIKSDTELRNQAYIELGRYLYENCRDGLDDDLEQICVVVDKTSRRIEKATSKYIELVAVANDTKIGIDNAQEIKTNIAVKLAQAKEKAVQVSYKSEEMVDSVDVEIHSDVCSEPEVAEDTKANPEDINSPQEEEKTTEPFDELTEFVDNDDADALDEAVRTEDININLTQAEDEESPDDFDF